MSDNEKASTGSMDPTVELAEAVESSTPPCNRKKWWMGGALAALVIFVVVFPTVYVTQHNKNATSSQSTSATATTTDSQASSAQNDGKDDATSQQLNSTFTTGTGPFNASARLGLFNQDILRGYDKPEDFAKDMGDAAWFLVEQVVQRNNGVKGYESAGSGTGAMNPEGGIMASPVADSTSSGSSASSRPIGSSYGTNNQEDNVEEGDLVVSDGNLVYAAYSDYIVIWDPHNGTMVAQVQMPPVDMGDQSQSQDDYYWYPKPNILNLVLYQDRILVVVQGYGVSLLQQAGITTPVLYSFLDTQVRVYNTAVLASGRDDPIYTANLQGSFNGVRVVNGNAYLNALSGVDTYTDLVLPFEKWNSPDTLGNMTNAAYTNESYQIAMNEAVPKFVNKLMTELAMGDSGFPNLVRLSMFQNDYTSAGVEAISFPTGLVNTLALVHSFNMMTDSQSLGVTSSGAFLPSYWAQFYGSLTNVIIAGQGQIVNDGSTVESTNFLSFSLQGDTAVPDSIGTVEGYILNNYAIDVKDNYLRVGVSIDHRWFFMIDPIPFEPTGGAATDIATTNTATTNATTENYIVIMSMPGLNGTEAGVMSEVGRLKLGKPNELFTAVRFYDNIAYAVTFERTDPLYVLDLSNPSAPSITAELQVLGFSSYLHSMNADNTLLLGIGQAADENGTVTGTKMSVFNMLNPTAPYVSAEYVIENTDNTWTYSAAQDDFKAGRFVPSANTFAIPIDSSNWQTGYHFNGFYTFFANETHIIKECDIGMTYNDSYYYIPVDTVVTDPGADGNSTTTGSGTGTETSAPSSATSVATPCFYCAYMPPRAMIFDGKLMTVNNHFIRSTNLNTCAEKWALDVIIQDNSTVYGCCGPYW